MLGHKPGFNHVERPERLSAVLDAIGDARLDLDRRSAEPAAVSELLLVHPRGFIDAVLSSEPAEG
jgi:acetoin utilization deacetylase AcuC-like enzyme